MYIREKILTDVWDIPEYPHFFYVFLYTHSMEELEKVMARLRELRDEKGLRQKDIADILDIERSTYADYELGRSKPPIDCVMELAEYYDVDMNYICGLSKKRISYVDDRKSD